MQQKMFKLTSFGLLLALCLNAASVCRGSGYEFEGVGARQVSRGGAAIADSDDWTSIYWNPGNMVKAAANGREFGIEFFGGQAFGHDSNSASRLPGLKNAFTKTDLDSDFILAALGLILPIGNRVALGMGFYTPLLQGAKFSDYSPSTGVNAEIDAHAGILTWMAGASVKITEKLSAGAGLDLLYGKLESATRLANYPIAGNTIYSKLTAEGFGLEGIAGVRYDFNPKWSAGAVYRSGSDVGLDGHARTDNSNTTFFPSESSKVEYTLRHPPTMGIGGAYRPTSKWTLTADADYTYWTRFSGQTRFATQGTFQQNIPDTYNWKNTWKYRLGMRYFMTEKTELLAGLAYDQPALDAGSIDLTTSIDVHMTRASLGAAHKWSKKLETTLGVLGGYGERSDSDAHYRLSGWQMMLENRFLF